jgi:hypothetical protein
MAWRFERPDTAIAWALIILRAAAAPLLAVYLSMARALPVTARDILAQAELASGAGVIRDVIVLANDRSASLADKLALYGASAVMTPADRSHLDAMIAVMRDRCASPTATGHGDMAGGATMPLNATSAAAPSDAPDRPPTGPGSPTVRSGDADGEAPSNASAGESHRLLQLPTGRSQQPERRTAA